MSTNRLKTVRGLGCLDAADTEERLRRLNEIAGLGGVRGLYRLPPRQCESSRPKPIVVGRIRALTVISNEMNTNRPDVGKEAPRPAAVVDGPWCA
jgi:hypothetical protein